MFTGNYSINMDAKGRMAIPTKIREGLVELCAGRLVVTAHTEDKCLLVYPESRWKEILPAIQALPAMNRQARRVQRLLIGHACSLELDGNGRILVPPTLRSHACLDKKLMLAGLGDKLELWDESAWTALMEEPGDDDIPAELQSLVL
ncbi:division/cell wall cluster transcriptional repressor MraZ [Gilvimarinus sp. SDUM040013]|uniref:Transcriptional regulator MraZ n=1 Tax=Gilvimarinus gilvus TaxID=3058038 RepID=A0ABU4RSS6_9GAMM|nr:division/cell wall cluster transcriptional repressor MraZ [Gilvimarinus sp. SDUM040013]MDO3388400.1 division/cell wall cluster transcriptional repressor MraZ [Gilvimarinus sp. SDUM040013]MDX6847950.1 division/cell wall cluster transcriptional repressor MraZ [Gilvimarinus sp. SDUM040013]